MKKTYLLVSIVALLFAIHSVKAHTWHTHTTIDEVHDDEVGVGIGFTIPEKRG